MKYKVGLLSGDVVDVVTEDGVGTWSEQDSFIVFEDEDEFLVAAFPVHAVSFVKAID